MRTSSDESLSGARLAADLPDGNLIECGSCGYVFKDVTACNQPSFCKRCRTELFYRPWYSW